MSNLITFFNFILLLWLCWLVATWRLRGHQPVAFTSKQPRSLRPRSPKDCALCCLPPKAHLPQATPEPWHTHKSNRGRPKSIPTDGQYCDNPDCPYFHIRDSLIHALVGDGVRGAHDPIQWFRCQACGHRFSQRRHTAMHALKTPVQRVDEVVTALAEGVSQAAATRIFKHHPTTIARWRDRFAALDAPLHHRFFFGWLPLYIQLDELKARVRRTADHATWLWLAFEARSKVLLSFQVGPRNQAMAHALVHDVKHQLPTDAIPLFVSDGLRLYFYALTAHFGFWQPPPPGKRVPRWHVDPRLLFAQLIKVKSGYTLKALRTAVRCGQRTAYRAAVLALGFSGRIETAFIERFNLTLRHLIAPLARRTWAIAHNLTALQRHIALARVYYHYCRPHTSLEDPNKRGRFRYRTPAMAAGVVHRRYSVSEILLTPV